MWGVCTDNASDGDWCVENESDRKIEKKNIVQCRYTAGRKASGGKVP